MKSSDITSINFLGDITSRYARRRFFWFLFFVATLFSSVLFLTIYFFENKYIIILSAILVNILSTSIFVLLYYLFYVYFIGENIESKQVSVVRPRDINESVVSLSDNVSAYYFWGRSGTHFRSETLVFLDNYSKNERIQTDIEIVLPDPSDDNISREYVRVKEMLGESGDRNVLPSSVAALVINAFYLSSKNKYLSINVSYANHMPNYRIDLSANGAILTQDDKKKHGLFFGANSEFHELFRHEIRSELRSGRHVYFNLERFKDFRSLDECVTGDVLKEIGISEDLCVDANFIETVLIRINSRKHRYK